MSKIFFIINPKAGGGKKYIRDIIEKKIIENGSKFQYTEYPGHAFIISKEKSEKNEIIVAVGGDGTVNETARGLIGSNCCLGIIPIGSGNGLARSFNIPTDISKAFEILKNGNKVTLDYIKINGNHSFNVSGAGFDALVAHKFASSNKRGFFSYIKIILKEFRKNRKLKIEYTLGENKLKEEVFLFSLANSSQFGNNAHIAPLAKTNDGLLDLAILKPFPLIAIPRLVIRLFLKKIHKSKYYFGVQTKSLEILNEGEIFFHCDGEPVVFSGNIKAEIISNEINIITPKI